MPKVGGIYREKVYAGTRPESLGVVEHDCLDCEHSWDTYELTYDDHCPECGSYDIEARIAKDNPYYDKHDRGFGSCGVSDRDADHGPILSHEEWVRVKKVYVPYEV